MFKRSEDALSLVDEILDIDGVPESAILKVKELQVLLKGLDIKRIPHPDPAASLSSLPALVQLKRSTFEDDWNEKGMIAYLTSIEWIPDKETYELTFKFDDFVDYNMPLLTECYYPNRATRKGVEDGLLKDKELYTALEADMVERITVSYFAPTVKGQLIDHQDDEACIKTLLDELVIPLIDESQAG